MKRNASIQDSPYGRLPSALAVQVGDIIQCDLGMRIVTEVTTKAATAIKLVGLDHPKDIGLEVSKSRIIERRGADGLKEFLLRKRALQEEERRLALNNPTEEEVMPKGMVKLEPGDRLCFAGKPNTVVAVTDRRALMEDADGTQTWDKRVVNEFMFTDCTTSAVYRLNEAERTKHLENFLAARKPSRSKESTQPNGTEEKEMKARVKSGKVATPKKAKEVKPKENKEGGVNIGISAFVKKLVGDGLRDDDLMAKVKAKFPKQAPGWVLALQKKILSA